MAINKKLIHFKTFANFNSKKLSANESNTEYTLGIDGEIQTGSPDILYQSICWIKDTKQQWTHGQLYDCNGGSSIDLSEYLTADEIAEIYATIESLDEKQDTLVSGTNIKTINGESIVGSGDISINIPDTVTENTVSHWGFTKNEGTITEVKSNGTSISTSGVANIPAASVKMYGVTMLSTSVDSDSRVLAATSSAVKEAYDLASSKQEKLVSGTNIMTARGQSLVGEGVGGDLFSTTLVTTNIDESKTVKVGECYLYVMPQTTAKEFILDSGDNTPWNDSVNIIIKTSATITFTSNSGKSIFWANGTTPTFDSDKIYEISFRYTLMGWLGVAVAFYSA